uniref:CNNM transmembrane domain-containing protein n=1 Tax=Ascaris lumbricoides TaxID=6252 RepID=A0A9J2P620_ASCLU
MRPLVRSNGEFSGTAASILSGLRAGSALDVETVEPNTKLVITLFGANLWPHGFDKIWLTSAEDCEKSYSVQKTRFYLRTVQEYSTASALVLELSSGLPEYTNGLYLLCTHPPSMPDDVASGLGKLAARELYVLWIPLWAMIIVLVLLVMMSALFSGLNLSFTSVALNELDILQRMGDAYQSRLARSIVPVRRHLNWIICTFATANAVTNCLISLLFELLINHVYCFSCAVDYSVAMLVTSLLDSKPFEIFSDQRDIKAVCNRRGLIIASKTRFITWTLMIILCPFAWPLSKLLDRVIGYQEILQNAITLPSVRVGNVMTNIEEAFLLSTTDVLDNNRILSIVEKGYTRIPIYEGGRKGRVVAVLNVKDLIATDFTKDVIVIDVLQKLNYLKQIRFVCEGMQVKPLMVEMEGQNFALEPKGYISHMAMVVRYDSKNYTLVGLITLDDIIEEIFGEMKILKDEAFQWTNRRIGVHRDQATFDWLRTKPDPIRPVDEMLRIQETLDRFPVFKDMSLNIYSMRHVFSMCRVQVANSTREFRLYKKGKLSRSIAVVLVGEAYCYDKRGRRCTPGSTDMGAELADAMFKRFVEEGVHADLNQLYFNPPRNVYLDAGGRFIKITVKAVRDALMAITTDRSKREITSRDDPNGSAEYVLNSTQSHTTGSSVSRAFHTFSLTGDEHLQRTPDATKSATRMTDSTQSTTTSTDRSLPTR